MTFAIYPHGPCPPHANGKNSCTPSMKHEALDRLDALLATLHSAQNAL